MAGGLAAQTTNKVPVIASPAPRSATIAAASGSTIRRTSNRLRTKSASGTSAICQTSTSASSRLHSLRGLTTVPRRGFDETRPLPASTFIASRTERREIESSAAKSSKFGKVVPGGRPPETMRRPMISAARMRGRTPLVVASKSCTVLPSSPSLSAGFSVPLRSGGNKSD